MPVAPPQRVICRELIVGMQYHFQSVHNNTWYYVFCSLANEKSTSSSLNTVQLCFVGEHTFHIYIANKQYPVENFVQNETASRTLANNLSCVKRKKKRNRWTWSFDTSRRFVPSLFFSTTRVISSPFASAGMQRAPSLIACLRKPPACQGLITSLAALHAICIRTHGSSSGFRKRLVAHIFRQLARHFFCSGADMRRERASSDFTCYYINAHIPADEAHLSRDLAQRVADDVVKRPAMLVSSA